MASQGTRIGRRPLDIWISPSLKHSVITWRAAKTFFGVVALDGGKQTLAFRPLGSEGEHQAIQVHALILVIAPPLLLPWDAGNAETSSSNLHTHIKEQDNESSSRQDQVRRGIR